MVFNFIPLGLYTTTSDDEKDELILYKLNHI